MIEYGFVNLSGRLSYINDGNIAFRGTWASGSTYAPPVDVVDYNNGKFITIITNSGTPPLGSSLWSEMVVRGTISPTDPFEIAQTALDTANAASLLAISASGTASDALLIATAGSNLAYSLATREDITCETLTATGTISTVDLTTSGTIANVGDLSVITMPPGTYTANIIQTHSWGADFSNPHTMIPVNGKFFLTLAGGGGAHQLAVVENPDENLDWVSFYDFPHTSATPICLNMTYSAARNRLYATVNSNISGVSRGRIVEIDPANPGANAVVFNNASFDLGTSAIACSGTFIYTASQTGSINFLKISATDFSIVQSTPWPEASSGPLASKISEDGSFVCFSTFSGQFAKVSTTDLSYTPLDVTPYMSGPADDMVVLNGFAYLSNENGASFIKVNLTNFSVEQAPSSFVSYGAFTDGRNVYNGGRGLSASQAIGVYLNGDFSKYYRFNIPGFSANEIAFSDNGLLYFTDWTQGHIHRADLGLTHVKTGRLSVAGVLTAGTIFGKIDASNITGAFAVTPNGDMTIQGDLSLPDGAVIADGRMSFDHGGITSDGEGDLQINSFLAVLGQTTLDNGAITTDGAGNINTTGKITASGGVDPPYVLYDPHTRQETKVRVLKEVPGEKQNGAALFWNKDTRKLEVYVASEDAFYSLDGAWLAKGT